VRRLSEHPDASCMPGDRIQSAYESRGVPHGALRQHSEVMCSHQALYKRVTEYLELEQRITILNNRFEVLTELLNIVREHENNLHIARLEWCEPDL
jgi:hypothetical protein